MAMIYINIVVLHNGIKVMINIISSLKGLIANSGTIITLLTNGDTFSPIVCLMLLHQSVVDAAACLFVILLQLKPFYCIPCIEGLDTVICLALSLQFLYLLTVFI